jgi:hypothetical protein
MSRIRTRIKHRLEEMGLRFHRICRQSRSNLFVSIHSDLNRAFSDSAIRSQCDEAWNQFFCSFFRDLDDFSLRVPYLVFLSSNLPICPQMMYLFYGNQFHPHLTSWKPEIDFQQGRFSFPCVRASSHIHFLSLFDMQQSQIRMPPS